MAASSDLHTSVFPLILRGVSLLGVTSTNCPMPLRKQVWERLGAELRPPGLAAIVSRVVPLAQVLDAAPSLIERRSLGRVLVDCGGGRPIAGRGAARGWYPAAGRWAALTPTAGGQHEPCTVGPRLEAGRSAPRLLACGGAGRALAQAAAAPARPTPTPATKSVYGKLLSVDTSLNNLLMTEDGGAKLAWHFDAPVIAEAARFKPGAPLIVIYRQTSPKQKRVTAIAFPGSAKTPIYMNMTSERVVLRSAAAVNDSCSQTSGAVTESTIPSRGLAEALDECWCCAPAGRDLHPGQQDRARPRAAGAVLPLAGHGGAKPPEGQSRES